MRARHGGVGQEMEGAEFGPNHVDLVNRCFWLAQRTRAPSLREGKCGPRPTCWVHRPEPNPSFAACDDGYLKIDQFYGQLYLRSRDGCGPKPGGVVAGLPRRALGTDE